MIDAWYVSKIEAELYRDAKYYLARNPYVTLTPKNLASLAELGRQDRHMDYLLSLVRGISYENLFG